MRLFGYYIISHKEWMSIQGKAYRKGWIQGKKSNNN